MHNFFLSYDSICVFVIVCEISCKKINFRVDFVYCFTWGADLYNSVLSWYQISLPKSA